MAVVLQSGYTFPLDVSEEAKDPNSGNSSSTFTTSHFELLNVGVGTAPGGGQINLFKTELTLTHSRSATSPQPPRYGAVDLFDLNKRYRITVEEEEV